MVKKAQAMLEFMMTYGWVLVSVMLVISVGVYYDVFSPDGFLSDSAVCSSGFDCSPNRVIFSSDSSEFFRAGVINSRGSSVRISNLSVSGIPSYISDYSSYIYYNGNYYKVGDVGVDVEIPDSSSFDIVINSSEHNKINPDELKAIHVSLGYGESGYERDCSLDFVVRSTGLKSGSGSGSTSGSTLNIGTSCGDGKVYDCNGGCNLPPEEPWLSYDFSCNLSFNCSEFHFYDYARCNEVLDCDGNSIYPDEFQYLGNGACDSRFNCVKFNNDDGDCCPLGQVHDCSGNCVSDTLGDGVCDVALNCSRSPYYEDLDYDSADCIVVGSLCPDGTNYFDCDGKCYDASTYDSKVGNGDCNNHWPNLNCDMGNPSWDYDGGECVLGASCYDFTDGTGYSGIWTCDDTCRANTVGDGTCDSYFNCDYYSSDGGDCGGK